MYNKVEQTEFTWKTSTNGLRTCKRCRKTTKKDEWMYTGIYGFYAPTPFRLCTKCFMKAYEDLKLLGKKNCEE